MLQCSGTAKVFMASQSFTSGKKTLAAFAVCLAAIAVWRACYMVSNLCANAITDDYIGIVPLVAAISSPGYNWSHFLAEATSGPHCFALPSLIYAAVARTTDWDCRTELFLGIFLTTIRCFVFAAATTNKEDIVRRSFVFAVFVLLSLGTSCTSVYMFGIPATASATGLLGMSVGLWTVVKMPGQLRALPIILLGGLVASSFGPFQTVATWLVYFMASAMLRVKNKLWYGGLFAGGVLGVLLLKAMHVTSSGAAPTKFSAYYFIKVLNILGRGFANNIGNSVVALPQATYAGAFGLVLLAVIGFFHWQRRTALARLAGPLAVTVYALLGAAAISFNREAIASWYCMYTTIFWSGLTALGGLLLSNSGQKPSTEDQKLTSKTAPLYLMASLPVLFILAAYPFTNIGYKNKDYFARDHAPSAETATRTFLSAPTYAEQVLYIPGEGNIDRIMTICGPLYCMGWGAFGHHQVWALQGDYLLPTVQIVPDKNSLPITWFKGNDPHKPAEWQDPEHLKLALDEGCRVLWNVELPAQSKSARLLTAASGAFRIDVFADTEEPGKVLESLTGKSADSHSEAVDMDLSKYRGRKLLIAFSGARNSAAQPCRFEYPRLDIETVPNRPGLAAMPQLKMKPANTDLSEQFPKYTDGDLVFNAGDVKLWRAENLEIDRSQKDSSLKDVTQVHLTGKGIGALTLAPGIAINENDYSYFAFGIDVPPQVKPRVFSLQIVINGGELRNVLVPLLPEGGMHKYCYDLKLLNLDPTKQQITALKLLPIYQRVTKCDIGLTELRFIKRK